MSIICQAKPTSYLTASPTFSLTDILISGRQTNSQVIVSGVPFPTRQKQKGRLIAGYKPANQQGEWQGQKQHHFGKCDQTQYVPTAGEQQRNANDSH